MRSLCRRGSGRNSRVVYRLARLLVQLALVAATAVVAAGGSRKFDVVIVGAGSGGVSAAIQAARLGASVALVEETDWIGGQMTAAGVSTMDEGHYNEDSGLYAEFISRIKTHYDALGKSIGTCYWSARTHCFEPAVGQKVLYAMIAGSKPGSIDVLLRTRVARVRSDGSRVTGVETAGGDTLASTVLIDATEYGDLLPLAPVGYRFGKFVNPDIDPAGCVQGITYTAIMKKYPRGVPPELRMESPPPGYSDEVRQRFALGVSRTGNTLDRTPPVSWAVHNAYRGIPDSSSPGSYTGYDFERITKTGVNWVNDYPATIGGYDPAARRKLHCEAKLRTLQFLYYVQTELGEPQWAIANDEGYDTPYNREENLCAEIPAGLKAIERQMPVMPYIRESRRLIGMKTMSAVDLIREGWPPLAVNNYPSAVAIGDYAIDLHGCNTDEHLEISLERQAVRPRDFRFGRFQVIFEQFVPETADGFLVAEKNLSQSRYFNGATRLQPIAMLTGQAAGAIAGLAVRGKIEPRRVDVTHLQQVLLEAGSSLALPMLSDVPRSHPRWPAVQLAVVKEWMPVATNHARSMPGELDDNPDNPQRGSPLNEIDETAPDGRRAFGIKRPVTRCEAALAVTRRAGIPPARPAAARFDDVPLYHNCSRFVEALAGSGAALPCRGNQRQFCPDEPVTGAEFVLMLGKSLAAAAQPALGAIERTEKPLTRGEAAEILWKTTGLAH